MFRWLLIGITLVALWGGLLFVSTNEGWHLSAIAPRGDATGFATAVEALLPDDRAVSFALVLHSEGEVTATVFSDGIDGDTLFPVASMSKWLTAFGVMLLVQDGAIDLDAPVGQYLSRWQFPADGVHADAVTTRQLLSHTAGLADGLGFADYAEAESLPSLEDSLSNPRASSGQPVQITPVREPGSEWEYSGGGYLVLELLIEEVTGESFADFMQRRVFDPLRMTRSTYGYLGDQPQVAPSLTNAGEAVPYYRYAAAGATGLGTTPNDMTRFVQSLTGTLNVELLSPDLLRDMRSPEGYLAGAAIWGSGTMLYVPVGEDFVFGHAGRNEPAINAEVRINPRTSDAVVVMVMGDDSLATQVGYEWTLWQTGRPDFLHFPSLLAALLPWFAAGVLLILVICILGYRRQR